MKYILNNQYKLDKIENLKYFPEYQHEVNSLKGQYVLINESKKNILLINSTIYNFISYFIDYNTIENVINYYSNKIEVDNNLIEKKITKFFNEMVKKRVLVHENNGINSRSNHFNFSFGDFIGNYRVIETLVEKGSVVIYKASLEGKIVIVKLTPKYKFDNIVKYEDAISTLKREYQTLKKLQLIQSVVDPIELIESDNFVCLILDYIEGMNLSQFIRKVGIDKELHIKLKLIKSLLKTCSELHKNKILHGDIHASNFIIDNSDNVKVIDFGCSQIISSADTEVLKHGGVVFYMPPERISKEIYNKYIAPPTLQSEVYQIGVLIYMILYNKMPFTGLTWKKLANNILNTLPLFLNEINNEIIPNNIISFIQKALNKDYTKRFETAIEMSFLWNKLIMN